MKLNPLPCEVLRNRDGSISLMNMDAEFVDSLIGYAVSGATADAETDPSGAGPEIKKYTAISEAIFGPMTEYFTLEAA